MIFIDSRLFCCAHELELDPQLNGLTDNQQFLAQVFTEKRPLDTVGASVVAKLFETVGLSLILTWWGTRTNPFN